MIYQLKNLRLQVDAEQNLIAPLQSLLQQQFSLVYSWRIIRRALDTRKHNFPYYVYTLELNTTEQLAGNPDIIEIKAPLPARKPEQKLTDPHPYIVGMGPAGLFCALAMVENGLQPYLFDRGEELALRAQSVSNFWAKGELNPASNVQFGEGGAGAFSDGKLTARSHDYITDQIFDYLIRFGAPDSIRWEALPHLGTDGIRLVVAQIREFLLGKGCRFFYSAYLNDLIRQNQQVKEIFLNGESHSPEILCLAPGNAARDTFRLLNARGVQLAAKPFSMGVRISHPQAWINQSIFGHEKWVGLLGPASYRLTAAKAGNGTYTFCMCPGGQVIAASSEPNGLVINGMSYSARQHDHGNSAMVTNIGPESYGNGLFDGMEFQAKVENSAFRDRFPAPYQTAPDFIAGRLSTKQNCDCLFPSAEPRLLTDLFPSAINSALQQALLHFDQIMPGFIRQGMLIAPETRTSSPIRILRDMENLNCLGVNNLYAAGEGAGYAGGIISSATDGFRIGMKFTI